MTCLLTCSKHAPVSKNAATKREIMEIKSIVHFRALPPGPKKYFLAGRSWNANSFRMRIAAFKACRYVEQLLFLTSFCLVLNVVNLLHFVLAILCLLHLCFEAWIYFQEMSQQWELGVLLCTLHLLLQERNKKVMNVRINAVLCFITTLIPPSYQYRRRHQVGSLT